MIFNVENIRKAQRWRRRSREIRLEIARARIDSMFITDSSWRDIRWSWDTRVCVCVCVLICKMLLLSYATQFRLRVHNGASAMGPAKKNILSKSSPPFTILRLLSRTRWASKIVFIVPGVRWHTTSAMHVKRDIRILYVTKNRNAVARHVRQISIAVPCCAISVARLVFCLPFVR